MEALVQRFALERRPEYKVVPQEKADVMLSWKEPLEIQQMRIAGLKRVAAIGDGNCLLHSMLYATSPTYRSHENTVREYLAAAFRTELITRIDALRDLAMTYYPEYAGEEMSIIPEMLGDLVEGNEELDVKMAPIIGLLYGYNLLLLQITATGHVRPVRSSFRQFNPALPSLLIHYVGGGVDFGHREFQAGGHYEPIVSADGRLSSSDKKEKDKAKEKDKSKARSTRKKAKVIHLPVDTKYVFPSEARELTPILALFETPSG